MLLMVSEGWVEHRVMELETFVPRRITETYKLIGSAEVTNTIFINVFAGTFMLDIKSKKVRMFRETENHQADRILPYASFYAPR